MTNKGEAKSRIWTSILIGVNDWMTNQISILFQEATHEFGELLQAEQKLINSLSLQKTEFISFIHPGSTFEELILIDSSRIIRSEIILWLCTKSCENSELFFRGLFIHGALIKGKLNLAFMKLDIPILFRNCLFNDKIILDAAQLRGLSLEGCKTCSIQANALCIESGGVYLRHGFRAIGEVNFSRALINGDFDCIGGHFLNPGRQAIIAAGMSVSGNMYMKDAVVEGEINLTGFSVEADFACSSARFENRGKATLQADGAKIKGSLKLNDGFTSFGKISLTGAIIEGYADFINATLINGGGEALSLDVALIDRDLALCHQFYAAGRIGLRGTKVKGTLYLYRWINRESVFLDLGFCSAGMLLDTEDSWPNSGKLILNGFTYDLINELSPSDINKRLQWLRSQSSKHYSFQPYEQLAKVYLASGYEDASDEVLIAKQKDHRKFAHRGFLSGIWDFVLESTIAYGYKPHKVLKGAVIMILIGTLLFKVGYSKGAITPTDIAPFDPSQGEVSIDYPGFHPFLYSVDAFVPIIDFHQQKYWLPNSQKGMILDFSFSKIRAGDILRYYLWIHTILGWLLTSLWVAGLTGVVRS